MFRRAIANLPPASQKKSSESTVLRVICESTHYEIDGLPIPDVSACCQVCVAHNYANRTQEHGEAFHLYKHIYIFIQHTTM